jgi:TatD DNase family protein
MQFVDTHCHIQSAGTTVGERSTRELWAKSKLQATTLVEKAAEASVSKLICVGCDLPDSQLAVDFTQQHESCWASIGIHPHEAKDYAGKPDKRHVFAKLAEGSKVIAVGECGFDFYYNHSPKQAQEEVLRFQIELALEHDLPMIFHVREAFDDFWPVFDSYKDIRGVLHSFTDSMQNMQEAVERGLYIGVNGIATFAKSESQLAVYKTIPADNLLLETDAPFLTPTPYRGTINEPKFLVRVAEHLSELRGESLTQISQRTTANANRLFGI